MEASGELGLRPVESGEWAGEVREVLPMDVGGYGLLSPFCSNLME